MFGLVIGGIIAVILGVIIFMIVYKENSSLTLLGIVITLIGLILIVGEYRRVRSELKEINYGLSFDFPEEIYEVRKGDTLYVNKRTRDSIYLEFKHYGN